MSKKGHNGRGPDYLRGVEFAMGLFGLVGVGWLAKIPWRLSVLGLVGLALVLTGGWIAVRRLRVRRDRQRLESRITEALEETHKEISRELPQLPISHPVDGLRGRIEGESSYVCLPFAHRSIQPSLTSEAGSFERGLGDPVDYALQVLSSGKSVLVTGEPGCGKSVMSAVAFAALADAYLASPRAKPLPLFVRLNALRPEATASSGSPVMADLLPAPWDFLTPDDLESLAENPGLTLILDGLDEVGLTSGPHVEQVHLPPSLRVLLTPTCLITCREAFHDLYVASSPLHHHFDDQIALLPMQEQQIREYVSDFCARHGRTKLTSQVLSLLSASSQLEEMASRPLLLRMTTHVLLSELEKAQTAAMADHILRDDAEFLTALIYEAYIRDWLLREQQKRDGKGQLGWTQTLSLTQRVAYRIFSASTDTNRAYSAYQLGDLLISREDLLKVVNDWARTQCAVGVVDEAVRQVAERTFLLVAHSEGMRYRFAHKSFYEFLLARYVVDALSAPLQTDPDQLMTLLGAPFPDEVVDFLRQLLSYAASSQSNPFNHIHVEANFMAVVQTHDENPVQLMARQQAANLLPIVASEKVMQQLRALASSDDLHPFIKRAICVGVALHHDDSSMLDAFVRQMDQDPKARSFHMGYNRIYYGDQPLSSSSFQDDGEPECSRFFRASVRHLQEPRYRTIRSMAAASIEYMLRMDSRCAYLQKADPDALQLAGQTFESLEVDSGSGLAARRLVVLRLLSTSSSHDALPA